MRTGDEAVIRKAPSGHEHIFIVDRIKELIKVKVSSSAQILKEYEINRSYRAIKSHPQNWKHISSLIPTSMTAP
jgi:hypothetical protein